MNPLANLTRKPLFRDHQEGSCRVLEMLCHICKENYIEQSRSYGYGIISDSPEAKMYGGFCSEKCQKEYLRRKFSVGWE